MNRRRRLAWVLSCLFLPLATTGCGNQPTAPPTPSYADLLVIYNAELEALDRLESHRDKLLARYHALKEPPKTVAARDMLKGLLDQAGEAKRQNEDALPADADALLDRALENANQVEAIASQVLDAATAPTPEVSAAKQQQLDQIQGELERLAQQISGQKKRVDRARDARDAADPNMGR